VFRLKAECDYVETTDMDTMLSQCNFNYFSGVIFPTQNVVSEHNFNQFVEKVVEHIMTTDHKVLIWRDSNVG
jgi:hypothetical protein